MLKGLSVTAYSAQIEWRDGSPDTAGTVSFDANTDEFLVLGHHTYTQGGQYQPIVIVSHDSEAPVGFGGPQIFVGLQVSPDEYTVSWLPGQSTGPTTLASFWDPCPDPLSSYSATIDWGDGSVTPGTVVASGSAGTYQVTGSHLYSTAYFTITVTITDSDGSVLTVQDGAEFIDQPDTAGHMGPLTGGGLVFHATEGTVSSPVVLALLTDDLLSDIYWWSDGYTQVWVDWGNGNQGPVLVPEGSSRVESGLLYDAEGTYTITVWGGVDANGNVSGPVTDTVIVTEAPASTRGYTIYTTPQVPISQGYSSSPPPSGLGGIPIADYIDPAFDYGVSPPGQSLYNSVIASTPTIDWGDGSSSTGTIESRGIYDESDFYVMADHTYQYPGKYTVVSSISGDEGIYTAVSEVDVEVPLEQDTIQAVQGLNSGGTLVTFQDSDPSLSAASFSATIDWGDGQTSQGIVLGDGHGNYQIQGSHAYANANSFIATVTLNDPWGDVTVGYATVNVVAPTPQEISAVQNVAFSGTVAFFPDPTAGDTAGSLSAVIDWGDGQASQGTVVADPAGGYDVTASHTYGVAGVFVANVIISDSTGASSEIEDDATVSPGLSATPGAFLGVQDADAEATLATFTDDPEFAPEDLVATIDWGDGQTSAGETVETDLGAFTVSADHSYDISGSLIATVTISDPNGSSVIVDVTATIVPAVSFTPLTVSTASGLTVVGPLLTLTTADATGLTAEIDWGDGQSSAGTISANGDGSFSVAGAHVYSDEQTYQATVTITDPYGATSVGTGNVNVIPMSPNDLTAYQGFSFNNALASFQSDSSIETLSATIDWGDGQTSSGAIASNADGSFVVSGAHTWTSSGAFPVIVTVTDSFGGTATATSTALVIGTSNNAISAAGNDVSAWQNIPFTGVLGELADSNADSVGDGITASIDWGDGQTSTGTISADGNGELDVSGAHVWTSAGSFTVTVSITDADGDAGSFTLNATVACPLTLDGTAVFATQGQDSSGAVATLSIDDPDGSPSDCWSEIDWGDGQTSSGTIISNGDGTFSVAGDHVYTSSGNLSLTATVYDDYGNVVSAVTDVTVSSPLQGAGEDLKAVANKPVQAVFAVVSDADSSLTAGSFTATIDFGDGQASSGAIAAYPDGGFDVSAAYTYTSPGTYNAVVTIIDSNGYGTTVADTVTVAPMLSIATSSVSAVEGSSFDASVGTVTPSDPTLNADEFTGTIYWGDGNSSTATFTDNDDGTIDISASNTYSTAGSYTFTVSVADDQGDTGSASGTAMVVVHNWQSPNVQNVSYNAWKNVTLDTGAEDLPGILANDTVGNSDVLTVAAYTQPKYGSVTVDPTGQFVYTPPQDFVGQDQFSCTIADGSEVASQTVSVEVSNAPPVAQNVGSIIARAGQAVTIPLLQYASDPDGDPLTIKISNMQAYSSVSNTITVNPDGSVTVLPGWGGANSSNPAVGFTGPDAFFYQVNDGEIDSNLARVDLVFVQVDTWTGDGDGISWEDGDNWTLGTPPTPVQEAFIPRGATVQIDGDITFGSIDVRGTLRNPALSTFPHLTYHGSR